MKKIEKPIEVTFTVDELRRVQQVLQEAPAKYVTSVLVFLDSKIAAASTPPALKKVDKTKE